jgi:hypothetical protein
MTREACDGAPRTYRNVQSSQVGLTTMAPGRCQQHLEGAERLDQHSGFSVARAAIPVINDYAVVDTDQVALTGRPRKHAPYRSDSGHATTR